MNEHITIHGNPEKSVFGVIGKDVLTDENKFYIKVQNDSKNTGWKEIPPTPTPTPTITVTPSKTPIVTRQIITTQTPTISVTPSITPSVTKTSPLVTPSPTNTAFKTQINYTIVATDGGTAGRADGPSPSGTISVGTGFMQLQAEALGGYRFDRWTAPEAVVLSDPYSTNPTATGFNTFTDVTITANFSSDTPPSTGFVVSAIRDSSGRLYYEYYDLYGNPAVSDSTGTPNEVIANAGCATGIISSGPGYAYIGSGQGCY